MLREFKLMIFSGFYLYSYIGFSFLCQHVEKIEWHVQIYSPRPISHAFMQISEAMCSQQVRFYDQQGISKD
jgi:hypothetical protein